MSKIELKQIFKLFGPHPEKWLEAARSGLSKDELFARSGHTLGLRDINLAIEAGGIQVIMGLSGSGKSTLIRHLNRLIEPSAGKVLIDGEDVTRLDGKALAHLRQKKMSMVFQRFALFPHRTILENAAYGLAVQGVARGERERRAGEWLERVGLAGLGGQFPHQLSGGMQQRVGLARALATDAEIVLMDEAFSALDPLIRREMQDQLLALQSDLHKTVVFITHDLNEALRLGDRVAILKDGELVQQGAAQDILLRPADDYVRAFLQDVNRGKVLRARHAVGAAPAVLAADCSPQQAMAQWQAQGRPYAVVLREGRLAGVLGVEELIRARDDGHADVSANLRAVATLPADAGLDVVLAELLRHSGPVAVAEEDGAFVGLLSRRKVAELVMPPPAPAMPIAPR
jgi:glycine betaine/proline transport system ATP-binding protein